MASGELSMKYLAFGLFAAVSVPMMAGAAVWSPRLRGLLLSALIFSIMLGDVANINFLSMETYRGPDRGFEVTLTDLLMCALLLALLLKHRRSIRWVPYNTLWMAAMLFLATASTLASPEPILGTFTLFKALRFYLVYWVVVNTLRSGTSLDYVRDGLVAIGSLATVLVVKQKYLDGIYRIPLLFDHSNTVPLYLNLVMPMLLLWGLCDPRLDLRRSTLAIVAALGMVFAVVMTYSRAGTALAGLAVLACLFIANLRRPSRRVSMVSVVALLACLTGSVKVYDSFVDRIRNAPKASGEARDEFNYAAQMMAGDHVVGVGLNNFSVVLTKTAKYNQHIEVMANEEQAGVAHHIYWLTAAELGYAGLGLFLIIMLRFLWTASRWSWESVSPETLALTGIALGFVTLHASGFLEWALRISPVTYQFAVVAGVAAHSAEAVRRRARARRRLPKKSPVVLQTTEVAA